MNHEKSKDLEIDISTMIDKDDALSLDRLLKLNNLDPKSLGGWLLIAASDGKCECMKVLMKAGTDVNFSNADGETPFSFACANDQFNAAKLLYHNGAHINSVDNSGATPLDWAVCHSSAEFRRWLVGVGGRRNLSYEEWSYPQSE